ncbi:putative ribonuclease H-like domain-containing protein [Tanacetum coccineum]|uniref:Ribonuclease H-like domain-containing protein n=1 Tax=Tanacetum coccineum TaxID=301880 RepID=A0ABQ5BPF8_9ASTR
MRGIVIRNKARLVAQGYIQEEGIDYNEVFALVARIKAIRLFLAYVSFMGFMVFQMDVKSAFLYGKIEEDVYMYQPLGFEDPDNPDKVYKVMKALYGLHQALRAWYETLAKYLLDNGFHRGKIDQTLFIKKQKGDILLVQVYVNDIIFGFTKKELCIEFEKLMHDKFQMSFMGELTFFLGLQVKQKEDGIFISQDKYVADILMKFGFTDVKTANTPIDIEKPLLKDSDGEDVDVHLYRSMIGSLMYLTSSRPYIIDSPSDLVAYSDSDYARAGLDRKSTTGGCQFLRCRLISWQCKKQIVIATSSTEAEYNGFRDILTRVNAKFTPELGSLLNLFLEIKFMSVSEKKELRDIGLVVQGEGSIHPVESHHTPTSAPSTSQPPVSPTFKRTTRQEFVVPQPRSPTRSPVADEAASTGVDVRYGGATTTVIGFEAGQGSGNIYKTPTMPHDSPLPRVNTLRSDEGSMIQQELMVFCRTLSKKVESLKTNLKQTKQIYGATYTKHIKNVKSWRKQLSPAKLEEGQELLSHDDEDDFGGSFKTRGGR